MHEHTQKFEAAWEHFVTGLRGQLHAKAKENALGTGAANLVLKGAIGVWFSAYSMEGRWLESYTKDYPEKGARITSILKNELRFIEEQGTQTLPPYMKYAIPIAGALIGGGVAYSLTGKFLPQVIGAAVPAAVLYSAVNSYGAFSADENTKKKIDTCTQQLAPFKASIVNLIES